MLGPLLCGLVAQAPLLPKLRGHFAEFLGNASSVSLRILSSSTCVGLRYGHAVHDSGFSRRLLHALRYFLFAPRHGLSLWRGFSTSTDTPLGPGSVRARASSPCPHSSDTAWCRNINLLSIGYAFGLALGPDFPRADQLYPGILGYSAWGFPPHLATHSGILPSWTSTALYSTASVIHQCSPTNEYSFLSFGGVFEPRSFSAQALSASELLRTL